MWISLIMVCTLEKKNWAINELIMQVGSNFDKYMKDTWYKYGSTLELKEITDFVYIATYVQIMFSCMPCMV